MTPPVFPALPGQGWSVLKRPLFSTRVASHVSGREVRLPLYDAPLYEFELTFEALASNASWPGLGAQSLQTLLAFFLQCQGQFGTFVYFEPADQTASGEAIGTGDGATTSFALQRSIDGQVEQISWVSSVQDVAVGGSPQTSGWSLAQPNRLAFSAPPPAGAAIVAGFTFGYLCRFLTDSCDLENIMQGLWTVRSLKFRSVRS